MQIGIINGPNLQHIGLREPNIYGTRSWHDYMSELSTAFPQCLLTYTQSHHEGVIIDELYRLDAEPDCIGIVLNAGAYTHTSIAILDAIRAIQTPVVEVHLSNIYAREAYRRHSLIAEACLGQITGLGLEGYRLGIQALINKQNDNK